jgi:hypothetical protein
MADMKEVYNDLTIINLYLVLLIILKKIEINEHDSKKYKAN